MTDFKVGQRVWDMQFEWGTVKEVHRADDTYPVRVLFDTPTSDRLDSHFTEAGQLLPSAKRTLFFEEIPIPPSALKPKFVPEFVKGDVVEILVRGETIKTYEKVIGCTEEGVNFIDRDSKAKHTYTYNYATFRKVGHVGESE